MVARRRRYGKAAFYAYAHPAPAGFAGGDALAGTRPLGRRRSACTCSTGTTCARAEEPHAYALEFARSAFRHACLVCGWDERLAASAEGVPPPVA